MMNIQKSKWYSVSYGRVNIPNLIRHMTLSNDIKIDK